MESTTRPPDPVTGASPENPVLQSYRIFDERLVVMSESPRLAAHIHEFMKYLDGAHESESTLATVRLAVFNAPRKHVVMCSPELGVAKTVREHPYGWLTFRRIFMHLAVNMGRPHFPMHACCVANTRNEAALISGTSGAGKTSLTAAMLQRGFRFAVDDYALLDAEGQLWSLPIGSTVSKSTTDLVPELKPLRKRSCAIRAKSQADLLTGQGAIAKKALLGGEFRTGGAKTRLQDVENVSDLTDKARIGHEADLVLLGAREAFCDAVRDRLVRSTKECRDADRFLRLCIFHKVQPLVLRGLERLDLSVNSEFLGPCRDRLNQKCVWYWNRQGKRVARTMRVTFRTLEGARIPFCFLKGQSLARHYYLDPLLRVCADVDILIRPSDREKAIGALHDAEFRGHDTTLLQHARREYEGQAELRHPRYRVLLDVNWLLTANVGIGHVETDTERVWARARRMRGTMYRLSPEDEFFNIVRHVGHGHDFEDGFVRSCADTTAILRTCGERFDWDHVIREAEKSESLRILRFYTYFYDEYYRDENMPVLAEACGTLRRYASDRECACFAKLILAPLVRRKLTGKTTTQIVSGNICFAGKLWALDRMRRLLRILLLLPWPSKSEVVMLTLESRSESLAWRRIRYYFNPLLPGLPGVCLGAAARVLVEVIRRVSSTLCLLSPIRQERGRQKS